MRAVSERSELAISFAFSPMLDRNALTARPTLETGKRKVDQQEEGTYKIARGYVRKIAEHEGTQTRISLVQDEDDETC